MDEKFFYIINKIKYFLHFYSAWRGKGSSKGSSKSSTMKYNASTKKIVGLASFSQTKQYLMNPNRYMDVS
jgi:hypothetical protein